MNPVDGRYISSGQTDSQTQRSLCAASPGIEEAFRPNWLLAVAGGASEIVSDHELLGKWLEKIAPTLLNPSHAGGWDLETHCDAVQTVIARFLRTGEPVNLRRFKTENDALTFTLAAVENARVSIWRKRKRWREVAEDYYALRRSEATGHFHQRAPADWETDDSLVDELKTTVIRVIQEAVDSLCQQIDGNDGEVVKCWLKGMTYRRIQKELGCSLGYTSKVVGKAKRLIGRITLDHELLPEEIESGLQSRQITIEMLLVLAGYPVHL